MLELGDRILGDPRSSWYLSSSPIMSAVAYLTWSIGSALFLYDQRRQANEHIESLKNDINGRNRYILFLENQLHSQQNIIEQQQRVIGMLLVMLMILFLLLISFIRSYINVTYHLNRSYMLTAQFLGKVRDMAML